MAERIKAMSKKGTIATEQAYAALQALLSPCPAQCHFQLDRCGLVRVPANWNFDKTGNHDLHLLLVRDGHGQYLLPHHVEPLGRGKLCFVSNDYPHGSWADPDDLPLIMPVRFNLVLNRNRKPAPLLAEPIAVAIDLPDIPRYERLFDQLHEHGRLAQHASLHEGICSTLLYQIMAQLVLDLGRAAHPVDRRIELVQEHIQAHPSRRDSVDALAEIAGLSRKYFIRRFRELVGQTPHQYQIAIRCEAARQLLEETTLTVKEVAAELAYPDAFAFSKQYKQVMGSPPSEQRSG